MTDILAAVQTLADQKLHFERETYRLREMETKLRAELVERKIEIDALREEVRRLREEIRQLCARVV